MPASAIQKWTVRSYQACERICKPISVSTTGAGTVACSSCCIRRRARDWLQAAVHTAGHQAIH